MYIQRTLSPSIANIAEHFPVLLVTGPRQVGKTTLLQHCAPDHATYLTLDDLAIRQLAKEDPALFIQSYPTPLIIDEVQYAPELFPYLKIAVDRNPEPGQFWLTGSQQFHLMHDVSESLAGRVGIARLQGLSLAEAMGNAAAHKPFDPMSLKVIKQRPLPSCSPLTPPALYQRIWRGSYPALIAKPDMDHELFYSSYLQTYIQRDIRDLTQVGDEATFLRFLRVAAARTGQLINMAEMAPYQNTQAVFLGYWLMLPLNSLDFTRNIDARSYGWPHVGNLSLQRTAQKLLAQQPRSGFQFLSR